MIGFSIGGVKLWLQTDLDGSVAVVSEKDGVKVWEIKFYEDGTKLENITPSNFKSSSNSSYE